MKSFISIRTIIIWIFILSLIGGLLPIYKFYDDSRMIIGNIVSSNIKDNILTVSHTIKKEFQKTDNINLIKSKIDNLIINNNFIKDIIIIDSNGKIIYSFSKNIRDALPTLKLKKIWDYDNNIIINGYDGYENNIKLYRGIKKYSYKIITLLNKKYIDNLYKNLLYNSIKYFIVYMIFLILLLWIVTEKSIVIPLEKLRQFAYYHMEKPKEFIIKEIESIRYSLEITFNRLEKEQKELYKLSTRDSLTNLYNRMSLFMKIDELIVKSKRKHSKFYILFLDLDNFKDINDLYGHDVGDLVLQKVSKVILASIRENDFPYRIGGDEFVILVEEYPDNVIIAEICNRLLKSISNSIRAGEKSIDISVSIGVVAYPDNGLDSTELIKNADIAMYKAKSLGKNQFYFFNNDLNIILHEKLKLQQKMVTGLKNSDFELYYQPKVDLSTSKIVSCEALIRWNDKEEGLIPPFKFIPLAEENDFILILGEWVLKEGVERIKKWGNTPFENIKISINLSAKQFKDSKIVEKIKRYSENIDREKLDLEITESVFLNNSKDIIEMITQIKKLGITFSLDDFGTGYSSLSYLKDIPIDTLKIDKSFIDSYNDKTGKTFIEMIVDIGHTLNLQVVAEGVETKEQLCFLKSVKCDIIQGYYYSKPLRVEEFEKFYMDFMTK